MSTLLECAAGKNTDKGTPRECGQSFAELYEPYMAPMRNRADGLFVELGVSGGGSLKMWREYFGWSVLGVDIQPNCTQYIDHQNHVDVITASQDSTVIADYVRDRGGCDIVLDDASHLNKLSVRSFQLLWPLVKPGGLYIIEDMLCSYIQDIAHEVRAGGWGGMGLCKEPMCNDRRDIDGLIAGLASSIDTWNQDNRVASCHIHPQTLIIRKM